MTQPPATRSLSMCIRRPVTYTPVDRIPEPSRAGGGDLSRDGYDWRGLVESLRKAPPGIYRVEIEWCGVREGVLRGVRIRSVVDAEGLSWPVVSRLGWVYVDTVP